MGTIYNLAILGCLFEIARIDCRSRKIPNRLLARMLVLKAAFLLLECLTVSPNCRVAAADAVFGFFRIGGAMLALYLISKGGIGAGDVKLFSTIGFCLGKQAAFLILFRTLLSAAAYILVQLFRKKINRKQGVALAPFAFVGTVITVVTGS